MFFKVPIILIVIASLQLCAGQNEGESCPLDDDNVNETGVCTLVMKCAAALSSIKTKGHHQLRRCGFSGMMEILCCPQETQVLHKPMSQPGPILSRFGAKEGSKMRRAHEECENIKSQFNAPLTTHVIGGTEVEEGEFPHMAALGYKKDDDTYNFLCGGSLISDRYILTAAHCINERIDFLPKIVRVGTLDVSDPKFNASTDYHVDSVIVHPKYKRPKKYNDIALIRLKSPVNTSYGVYPVCINTKRVENGQELYITGWGKSDVRTYHTSNILLRGKVNVISNEECGRIYNTSRALPNSVTAEQICAWDEKIDACQGDSGGPLQYYSEQDGYIQLVGVTSFGKGCATKTPGVYTRVVKYLKWIEDIVWPN